MIIAVLLAPIFALKIDKYSERKKRKLERKNNIFKTLMTTRGKPLSPDHVEALNMIDIDFHDDIKVKNAWKSYLGYLSDCPTLPSSEGKSDEDKKNDKHLYDIKLSSWNNDINEQLPKLLFTMSKSLGYEFDETHIKRSIYYPQAHSVVENEQIILRRLLINLLSGEINLPVRTIDPCLPESVIESQNKEKSEEKLMRELIIKHYQGEIPTSVKIVK